MKQVEWMEISRRGKPIPLILLDAVITGFTKYFPELHDGKTRINYYRQVMNARWFGRKDFDKLVKMFKENEERIIEWMEDCKKRFLKVIAYVKKFKETDFTRKTNQELKEIFEEFHQLNAKACAFAYDYMIINHFYPDEINQFLKEKEKNLKKFNADVQTIFSLDQPIDLHKERIDLLQAAIKKKSKKVKPQEIKKLIEKITQKYGYLGMYLYYGKPTPVSVFQEKIKKLSRKPSAYLKKELRKEKNKFKENRKAVKALIKKLKLNRHERKAVKNVKTMLYTSMFCDELYTLTAYFLRPLLIEFSKRFNLSYNQVIQMRNQEIIEALTEGKISESFRKKINQRVKDPVIIFEKGKVITPSGKTLKKYTEGMIAYEKKLRELKELKGQTAFPGKVKGKARLIRSLEEFPKFQKGEVLVTPCTVPQYVPVMKKASAIVTDVGGLLSHAAIMSREFKKPCVIGTKIATKALKNGDFIEVNASQAIIKKIRL